MKSFSKAIIILSLILLFSAGGLYFALQALMPFMWILFAGGLCGLCWTAFSERQLLSEFFQLKTTKHGLSMGTTLFLTLCILAFANYFSVKFVRVFDLSMTKQYSLSEQSKKIIDNLNSDIEIKYFYKEGLQNVDSSKKAFLAQAKVYQAYSDKIKVAAVEINSNPSQAEIFGATKGTGDGFVSYKGKVSHIESQFAGALGQIYTEQDFTNAIIKSTRSQLKTIYFTEGHGERSSSNEKDEKSVSVFRKTLERNSYQVKDLNIIREGRIPTDADVIIIAGAQENFQKNEIVLIEQYLESGKPLFILLDNLNIAGINKIINQTGWQVDSNWVFNILNTPQGNVISTDQPTVANIFSTENEITKSFSTGGAVLFYRPHHLVGLSGEGQSFTTDVLVKTSDRSVALDKLSSADYKGVPKSFNMAVYAKGKYQKSNLYTEIIVIADANVAANQFFPQTSNKDLLLNSVAQLAKETDLVSLSPQEPSVSKIKMPGPEFNSYFKWILVGLFFPLPVLFLGISLFIWYRRRHA